MSSGENNSGLRYGASVAEGNVDFAEDANINSRPGQDKALLDKLKDALTPGDARKPTTASGANPAVNAGSTTTAINDATHDGRHGGVEEVMQPGRRDYAEGSKSTGGNVLDAVKNNIGINNN